jgi:glutamate racemase
MNVEVGVFDSGVGGLTVLRELLRTMPQAHYSYLGDTARLPYGSKSAATVTRYAVSSSKFLVEQGAEFLVIACNTATALALSEIEASVNVPVVGVITPGAEAAAALTRSRRVDVIGTAATIASHAYAKSLSAWGITATEKACPLFVPLVEEGWIDHPVTEHVAQIYLSDLGLFPRGQQRENNRADVLLLGCTHYPLLEPLLRRLLPDGVALVDSAASTAQALTQIMNVRHDDQAASVPKPTGTLKFFTTDSPEKFRTLGAQFLGRVIPAVELISLPE